MSSLITLAHFVQAKLLNGCIKFITDKLIRTEQRAQTSAEFVDNYLDKWGALQAATFNEYLDLIENGCFISGDTPDDYVNQLDLVSDEQKDWVITNLTESRLNSRDVLHFAKLVCEQMMPLLNYPGTDANFQFQLTDMHITSLKNYHLCIQNEAITLSGIFNQNRSRLCNLHQLHWCIDYMLYKIIKEGIDKAESKKRYHTVLFLLSILQKEMTCCEANDFLTRFLLREVSWDTTCQSTLAACTDLVNTTTVTDILLKLQSRAWEECPRLSLARMNERFGFGCLARCIQRAYNMGTDLPALDITDQVYIHQNMLSAVYDRLPYGPVAPMSSQEHLTEFIHEQVYVFLSRRVDRDFVEEVYSEDQVQKVANSIVWCIHEIKSFLQ
jgi:hypothetical protein